MAMSRSRHVASTLVSDGFPSEWPDDLVGVSENRQVLERRFQEPFVEAPRAYLTASEEKTPCFGHNDVLLARIIVGGSCSIRFTHPPPFELFSRENDS